MGSVRTSAMIERDGEGIVGEVVAVGIGGRAPDQGSPSKRRCSMRSSTASQAALRELARRQISRARTLYAHAAR